MTTLQSAAHTSKKLSYPRPVKSKEKAPKIGKLAFPSLCLMIAGTGGVIANENVGQLSYWVSMPAIMARKTHQHSIDARTLKEHLLNVRDTFHLNMTDLAKVFGVTRPTAYGWLDNVEPKPEAQMLVLSLSHAADRLSKIEGGRPEHYFRRPMFEGRSLVDLLKKGQNVQVAVASIEALAKKEAAVRKLATTRYAGKSKRRLENIDAMATPAFQESV